jgi:hypothetical protein
VKKTQAGSADPSEEEPYQCNPPAPCPQPRNLIPSWGKGDGTGAGGCDS